MIDQSLIHSIVSVPLVDLGDQNSAYNGILAPAGWAAGTGVTAQFLDEADTHHQRYFDVAYVAYELGVALDSLQVAELPNLILDVGSGSGPSVVALLERFPEAHVVATDTSPQLLAILRRELGRRQLAERCCTLCIDLNSAVFNGTPFDMAIGSAILHHLFEPDQFLERIFLTVRPGGSMAFFEPFEPGYVVYALVLRLILAQSNYSNSLPGSIADYFKGKVAQLVAVTCESKDPVVYAEIDDKWAFTASYFEDIGQRIGAKRTVISALNHTSHPFADQIRTDLRIALGVDASTLPAWLNDLVSEVENAMSNSCKRDFALGRTVGFTK